MPENRTIHFESLAQYGYFHEYANENGPVCVASQTGPFFFLGMVRNIKFPKLLS